MLMASDATAQNGARLFARRCPACFQPVGLFAVHCGACGYRLVRRHGGEADGALEMGAVLSGRYLVGRLLQISDQETVYAGFDKQTERVVRLTSAPAEGWDRAALSDHAQTLMSLAGCAAIVAPDEVWMEGDRLFAVSQAQGEPLSEGGRRIGDAGMRRCLARLTDALLVVHSLGAQPEGNAVHGAPCAENLLLTEDGALRLVLPLLPHFGEPADDIRGFGGVLLPLGMALSPAVEAILSRMCAGGYTSVLEIKHELNCL